MNTIDNSYIAGLITRKITAGEDGFQPLLTVRCSSPSDSGVAAKKTYRVAQRGTEVLTTTQTSDSRHAIVGVCPATKLERVLEISALDAHYDNRRVEVHPALEKKVEEGRVELPFRTGRPERPHRRSPKSALALMRAREGFGVG